MQHTLSIEIQRVAQSKLKQLDLENLPFGKTFTDHMLVCDCVNGEWKQPIIMPYQNISIAPSNTALHYGQLIFEGLKAYKRKDGSIWLFRPEAHFARFNTSAERMCMPAVPEEIFMEGMKELIRVEQAWIPDVDGTSLYIRPFMMAMDEGLGVAPSKTYRFMVITSPTNKYYNAPLKVKVENHYVRSAEGGVGFAKTAGNYAASLLPTKKANAEGYDQIIWTDAKEHKYFEETGTTNIMAVIGDTLVTPSLHESILAGVTRNTILTVARQWGLKVEERALSIDEVVAAHGNGLLNDLFGTGTAATIAFITLFSYNGKEYQLPEVEKRAFSNKVKQFLEQMRLGNEADTFGWMHRVA